MAHILNNGIYISGILNIILGILHQIVLYYEYRKFSTFKNPETTEWITNLLLYSMGIGTTLILMGLLSCYCYYGIENNEEWAKVVAAGISLLLLSFAIKSFIVQGHRAYVSYVHLLNSLLIGIPLAVNLIN
jgi:hypothetical protein